MSSGESIERGIGAADWGNREMLRDGILKDLIEGLPEVGLNNAAVSADILGDAYENTGECEVKMALRKTLFRYRLHQDQELFDRAYGYIREHY